MARSDNIAAALSRVRIKAEAGGAQVIQSIDISRADRELLLATGWLQEIMRGWYMLVRPDVATGDTAAWYLYFARPQFEVLIFHIALIFELTTKKYFVI